MSSWNRACVFAPDKDIAKHYKKTNSGARYAAAPRRKESGVVGKGFFGCSSRCRGSERFVMSKAQREADE